MPGWERKYMGRWKMPNDDYILRSDALRCKGTFEQSNGVEIELIDAVSFSYLQNIPAADVEPKQRWIPVTERLPEYPGRFMCVYEDEEYGEVGHCIDWGRYDPDDGWYVSGVTHWMPIPDLPESEMED